MEWQEEPVGEAQGQEGAAAALSGLPLPEAGEVPRLPGEGRRLGAGCQVWWAPRGVPHPRRRHTDQYRCPL